MDQKIILIDCFYYQTYKTNNILISVCFGTIRVCLGYVGVIRNMLKNIERMFEMKECVEGRLGICGGNLRAVGGNLKGSRNGVARVAQTGRQGTSIT